MVEERKTWCKSNGGGYIYRFRNFYLCQNFTIAGDVHLKEGDTYKPVIGAKIEITSQPWLCDDKTPTTWFYKNIVEPNKICVAETDSKGRFYLRVLSFSKKESEISATYKNFPPVVYPESKDQSLNDGWFFGNKNIKITIKTTLTGCWQCKEGSYYWWIKQLDDHRLTIMEKDDPKRQFQKYCFYNKIFSEQDGLFLYKLQDTEIPSTMLSKIEITPIDDKKNRINVKFLTNNEEISNFNCDILTNIQDSCSNSSKWPLIFYSVITL